MGFGYAVYFTERERNRVVRWSPDDGSIDIVAGESAAGEANQRLNDPYGLAFDQSGALLVSDKLNHRICRVRNRRLETLLLKDSDGHRARRPDSRRGYDPEKLPCPSSLFFEKRGALLAAFYDDNTIYRIHGDGRLELIVGIVPNRPYLHEAPRDLVAPSEVRSMPIRGPVGLVGRSDGTIFFIERHSQVVREYHPNCGMRSIFPYERAAQWFRKTEAPLRGRLDEYHPVSPTTLALDGRETLHLCDFHHASILKLDLNTGTFERVFHAGRQANREINGGPVAVAFGPDGTAWLANSDNQTIRAFAVLRDGSWSPTSARLEKVKGETLRLGSGGMGLLVGA